MLYFLLFIFYFISFINFGLVSVNEEILIGISLCLFFYIFFFMIDISMCKFLSLERRMIFFIFKFIFFFVFIKLLLIGKLITKLRVRGKIKGIFISFFKFNLIILKNYNMFKLWFKKSLMLVVFKFISYWTIKVLNCKEELQNFNFWIKLIVIKKKYINNIKIYLKQNILFGNLLSNFFLIKRKAGVELGKFYKFIC